MPAVILIYLLALMFATCSEQPRESAEFTALQAAEWIHDGRELPKSDSLFYLEHPAPLFRKEFSAAGPVADARLTITAAGYYIAFVNGIRVGENVLDPAWTDYSKRIYVTEYDVTRLLNAGDNCLGVTLGNGFYNPLPLRKWGRRNLRADTHVGKPTFLARLAIKYKDGTTREFVSDSTWKYGFGPIRKNSVYLGVVYDARKELPGWNAPGYPDDAWKSAHIGAGPGGKLQKAFFPPVQIVRTITPEAVYSLAPGLWIADMGENFTGTYRIKLSGSPGDTIKFRFGERIYEDGTLNPMTAVTGQIKRKGVGGPGAPDIAWQGGSYILGDQPDDWFQPEFTYLTYRYMEIAGLPEKPEISDIQGLSIHSNVADHGSFSSSSELLNSIQRATERTFLANLVSVQSDCPAREKFGYGGDINATSESFIYNFDMQAFYRKTVYDWVDAMHDSGFVDTAPFVGIQYCGISWESAFLLTQYYLYLYYNDTEIVRELYPLSKRWMAKVARLHPDGLVGSGLSDHESLEPVPVELTGTSHYLQCARVMSTFAALMGDEDGRQGFETLAGRLKNLIKANFWDKPVAEKINRQTLFSTLLYHGIVPESEIGAAKDSLQKAVRLGPSGHFSTGIFGTKYVLETVSQHLSPEVVFNIVNSTDYPGWGYMIDRGATTIWETWKESDNTYSNCHPMFGTVTEWYYRWLGGIRPDPKHPGFSSFTLAPFVPEGLEYVNCTYTSPYGPIVSNWKKQSSGTWLYEMAIPEGSRAEVTLPIKSTSAVAITRNRSMIEPEMIDGLQTGQFTLVSGEYAITVSND